MELDITQTLQLVITTFGGILLAFMQYRSDKNTKKEINSLKDNPAILEIKKKKQKILEDKEDYHNELTRLISQHIIDGNHVDKLKEALEHASTIQKEWNEINKEYYQCIEEQLKMNS